MKKLLVTTFLLCMNLPLFAQTNDVKYAYKKGEILDFLLLRLNEGDHIDSLYKDYRTNVFPFAQKVSFELKGVKGIKERRFGIQPANIFVLGKWNSLAQRQGFISNISKELPTFHQKRKALFHNFKLCYFELSVDLTFSLPKEQTHVVSAFWYKTGKEKSYKQWNKVLKQSKAIKRVRVKSAYSTPGYFYKPSELVIVSFENESLATEFMNRFQLEDFSDLENIEQFTL